MNPLLKAYLISGSLHLSFLTTLVASYPKHHPPQEKIVTIDFSMEQSQGSASQPIASSPPPQATPQTRPKPTFKPVAKSEETILAEQIPVDSLKAPQDSLPLEIVQKEHLPSTYDSSNATNSTLKDPGTTTPQGSALLTSNQTASANGVGKGHGTGNQQGMVTAYIQGQFTYIRQMIAQNTQYPRRARKRQQEGTVLLSFTIQKNGLVSGVKIIKSSGHSLLDKNAISAIQKTAPFPKPPFMAELKIPITYKLL